MDKMKFSSKAIIIGFLVQLVSSYSIGMFVSTFYSIFLFISGVPLYQLIERIPSSGFVVDMGVFSEFFATMLGGYTAARIAKHSELKHALAVGILLESVAIMDTYITPHYFPMWYSIIWLSTTIPAAVLGGYLRACSVKREGDV